MRPRHISTALLATIALILAMAFLSSCTTAGKATRYFDKHEDTAAGYCAVKFPVKVDSTTRKEIDTVGYNEFVNRTLSFSDSLLRVAEEQNKRIDSLRWILYGDSESWLTRKDSLKVSDKLADSFYAAVSSRYRLPNTNAGVAGIISRLAKVDTAALRKAIEAQIRATLQPCWNITKTYTVENTAKWKAQKLRADKYQATADEYTNGRNSPATVAGWLVRALVRKWWFWVIVVVALAFVTRKLWAPRIPFLN